MASNQPGTIAWGAILFSWGCLIIRYKVIMKEKEILYC